MGERKAMERGERTQISIEDLERTIKEIIFEEDLKPYRTFGNNLYELPINIITNKKGLDKFLWGLKK